MTILPSGVKAHRTQRYHDDVVELVRDIARKRYRGKGSAVSDRGKFLPSIETDPWPKLKRLGIQPDVWVKKPNGHLTVYEVWAKGEAFDKATYELFRIALRVKVDEYNIVCLTTVKGGKWNREVAGRLAKMVLNNVKNSQLDLKQVHVAELDLNEIRDDRRIKKCLENNSADQSAFTRTT